MYIVYVCNSILSASLICMQVGGRVSMLTLSPRGNRLAYILVDKSSQVTSSQVKSSQIDSLGVVVSLPDGRTLFTFEAHSNRDDRFFLFLHGGKYLTTNG